MTEINLESDVRDMITRMRTCSRFCRLPYLFISLISHLSQLHFLFSFLPTEDISHFFFKNLFTFYFFRLISPTHKRKKPQEKAEKPKKGGLCRAQRVVDPMKLGLRSKQKWVAYGEAKFKSELGVGDSESVKALMDSVFAAVSQDHRPSCQRHRHPPSVIGNRSKEQTRDNSAARRKGSNNYSIHLKPLLKI